MEKFDLWKKYPTIFIGAPVGSINLTKDYIFKSLDDMGEKIESNIFYFFHLEEKELSKQLEIAQKKKIPCHHIFILSENYERIKFEHEKYKTEWMQIFQEETPDEFRHRLQIKLEIHRQEILKKSLQKFNASNDNNDPAIKWRANNRARLVHALATTMNTSPEEHLLGLELALYYESNSTADEEIQAWLKKKSSLQDRQIASWPSDFPFTLLLVEIAELAIRSENSFSFRSSFRTASAKLSFKTRSEIKTTVEVCFQHLWGEHNNAA